MIAVAGKERLAYVVPTKDRPEDLSNLLDSLARQTRSADQIIIVDGGDRTVAHVAEKHGDLPIVYVREYPPSLARQRNAGVARLRGDITVAGYLDDDLVLEPDATERMLAFWESADGDIGGAAFNILNQPRMKASAVTRLFLLNGRLPGAVLQSGWPSQIPRVEETVRTEWLYGGATLWRREILRKFDYDEWYIGHGYGEDLDYSYRVSRRYPLFVVADARVHHYTRPIRLASQFTVGRQQVVNRLYFIRKSGGFSRPAVAWAMFGQLVVNLSAGVLESDHAGWRRAAGNVDGLFEVMRSGVSQIGGLYK